MITLKRLLLLFVSLIILCVFVSCKAQFLKTEKLRIPDFSEVQKVQLVTNDKVYNIMLSHSEKGNTNITFVDDAPETLLRMKVKIHNDVCDLTSDDINFSANINNFSNDFLPLIIYKFLVETDFQNEQFNFNSEDDFYFIEKCVLGKTVIFNIQLSLTEDSQSYLIEIK